MFGRSDYARARSAAAQQADALDRRLRSLEQRVQRTGGQAIAATAGSTDYASESLVSLLKKLSDRFQESGMSEEAGRIGGEAVRYGNDALRRLSKEAQLRPLTMLAAVGGIGLLMGFLAKRR